MASKYVCALALETSKFYLSMAKAPCRCDKIRDFEMRRLSWIIWEPDRIKTVLIRVTQEGTVKGEGVVTMEAELRVMWFEGGGWWWKVEEGTTSQGIPGAGNGFSSETYRRNRPYQNIDLSLMKLILDF
ncbi:hypothetical protein HJG60_008588 [Phyllostomus discolor]|uniref:Uncharacterized protein n=1 Tax=Phyllostomus discolor TaxID=89673 RepID=A0A833YX71_9CHIR|nr:hypothetical protein HJG60_008588 [Phyllostomus discolor]